MVTLSLVYWWIKEMPTAVICVNDLQENHFAIQKCSA
jgi:hypothetical protein